MIIKKKIKNKKDRKRKKDRLIWNWQILLDYTTYMDMLIKTSDISKYDSKIY